MSFLYLSFLARSPYVLRFRSRPWVWETFPNYFCPIDYLLFDLIEKIKTPFFPCFHGVMETEEEIWDNKKSRKSMHASVSVWELSEKC